MIEGMNFDIGSIELKEHLEKRANHHKERAVWYAKQAVEMADDAYLPDGSPKFSNTTGNNPVDTMKGSAKRHNHLSDRFIFMARHVAKDESYRLTDQELQSLEFIERPY